MNLIVEQIDALNKSTESDEEKLYVLRFNPWNFSDQNQLVFQFLKQFRAHLLKFEATAKKNVQRIVDSLDDYAEALAPPLEVLPYGKVLSQGLKFGLRGARKLLGSGKEIGDIFDQLSIQSAALKRRTVVLIDDIDRLNAAETRQIFQLVKLTARFPYVVYVLAFDRSAVAAALEQVGVDSGEEYLEKIVQVSFDLPAISDATLTSFITQGIESLLAQYKPAHFDMHRFGNLFHGGFRPSFSSVRHVRRFLNGLEFSLSLIGHEVNGVDVIGVEALKTFYPRTFEIVRSNRDLFAGHIDEFTRELGAQEFAKKVNQVMSAANEPSEELKSLLIELFPKIEYAFGHTLHAHGSEKEWEKTYRVGTKRYFDVYFQLALPPSEISVAEVSRLILECTDEAKCLTHLKEISTQGKLKAAMDSLRFRLDEISPDNLLGLLGALLQIGDAASESGAVFAGQIPEYWHVRWAIFDVLDRLTARDRPRVLLDIAQRVLAPRTIVNVISLIEELRQKENKYAEFGDEQLNAIKAATAERIRRAAINHEIPEDLGALTVLLYAWREWGNREQAASYVQSITDADEKLAKFLNKFVYQSHSAGIVELLILDDSERLSSEAQHLESLGDVLSKLAVLDPSDASQIEELVSELLGKAEHLRREAAKLEPPEPDYDDSSRPAQAFDVQALFSDL